jgi:hypothetical protein
MLLVRYRREKIGPGPLESIPVPDGPKLYALVLDIALIGKMPPKQP